MNNKLLARGFILAALLITNAVKADGYVPKIDTEGFTREDIQELRQDLLACREVAKEVAEEAESGNSSFLEKVASGATNGASLGLAHGAMLGAAAAVVGHLLDNSYDNAYREGYKACMVEEGWEVIK